MLDVRIFDRLCSQSEKVTAALGFDGYIDRIARVIAHTDGAHVSFFPTIDSFSAALGRMAGLSGDLEMVTQEVRCGGNAPIIASVLEKFGVQCTLSGAVETSSELCWLRHGTCLGLAKPGETLALEFQDGKIMLADISGMRQINSHYLKNSRLWRQVQDCFYQSDLCVLANWSSLEEMNDLWEDTLSTIRKRSVQPLVYLDFADPSKRPPGQIRRLISMIAGQSPPTTYIGLNEKETMIVALCLTGREQTDVQQAAKAIAKTAARPVIVHGIGYALYSDGAENQTVRSEIVEQVKISTGAGDHFSGAFLYAMYKGCTPDESMCFANAVSAHFVATGQIPALSDLIR